MATPINVALQIVRGPSISASLSGGSVPDATTTTKGKIKLAGDLGGTADNPTVPTLANKQPLDTDLTNIAALSPVNDDIIQRKSGSWTNRTPAQFKADLSLTKSDVGLGNVDNTSDANKPVSTATQAALDLKADISYVDSENTLNEKLANKAQPNGYASLDSGGKVPSGQLPDISITNTFVVSSQSAMLALSAQVGDVAVRTDVSKSFILTASDPSILANWQELLAPLDSVTSVNGRTGTVIGLAEDNSVVHLSGSETITGNKTFSTGVRSLFSAQTGDSTISRLITLQALDDYSRAWITALDKDGRNQASWGWHGVNYDDAIDHHAYEIKTSVSPSAGDPTLMQTRFAIQSDRDLANIVLNYLQSIIMYKGDGSNTITFQVDADTGKVTVNGTSDQPNINVTDTTGAEVRANLDATHYISLLKKSSSGAQLKAYEATGSVTLDIDAVPNDGTSAASVRLFRNVSTTNTATGFSIYAADGTSSTQSFFGAKSNSYFNANTGSFMIGKSSSPLAKLDVNGDMRVAGKIANVTDPTLAQDAATKNYVDTLIIDGGSA